MSIKLEVIETYLSGPKEYETGLQIYLRYGKNEALKKILCLGPTTYNHNKLLEALRALFAENNRSGGRQASKNSPPLFSKTKGVATPGTVVPGVSTRGKPSKQPFKVAPNHPELIKLYRERSLLKNQIPLMQSALDRMNAAFRILYISEEVERILFTGLPGQYLPKDRAELVKRHENNRKYISKYKEAPEKIEEVKRRQNENDLIQSEIKKEP